MDLATYDVDLSNTLSPQVTINGEKVPGLRRVSLDCAVGDIPHLYLELFPNSEVLSGQGVVVQRIDVPSDGLEVLSEFLGSLDPAELERAILERFGGFSNETTGQACLAVLQEWVKRG